jgi:plasmid stabilization system protein ParE
MVLNVIWSPKSEKQLLEVSHYLENRYGELVAKKFILKVLNYIETLSKLPNIGTTHNEKLGIKYLVITKQNTLVYQVRQNTLHILNIYDNRQNPKNKKY